ncbi:hypothetical protein [Pseudomonas savastanoi]|uniref:hypothetical protein n=1 Tax=Pseudomonas savastanoi TaxID=29438 RepID=UPI001F1D2185|nr:hypothetical protein [Pseudomonas savastanoi]
MQGTQLTASDRRRIDQQRAVQASMQSVLRDQVDQTLAEVQRRKEHGIKPEKVWFHDRESSWQGTISVAEWMGY